MGMESFYVNLTVEKLDIRPILQKYEGYCRFIIDEKNDAQELCIEGALVSFLPVCGIMFDICCELEELTTQSVQIESRRSELPSVHTEKTDFVIWMYNLWAEKLQKFYETEGGFILTPKQYYDTRSKMLKYYQKLPERECYDSLN